MVRAKVRREVIATRYHEKQQPALKNAPKVRGQRDPCVTLVFPETFVMPKLKTHKGASKRFKKTGTGKIVRQHAFARHILTSKGRKRKNKLHQSVVADDSDQTKLARMIPY